MGCKTLLLTHYIETLGKMSCYPSIGGIGKGHLVKEVDAMGGAMALATDEGGIQFRILNSSKGPAVRATRAQADRILYKAAIRRMLENQPNLWLFQQAVDDLMVEGDRVVEIARQAGLTNHRIGEDFITSGLRDCGAGAEVVLANAANVLAGGEADPNAAAAGRRAVMASRQNAIFSVAMLYFMVYKGHAITSSATLTSAQMGTFWAITLIIIAVLEINALGLMPWKTAPNKGLNVLYDGKGVRNPLIAAFGLWVIFLILTEIFFQF